MRISLYSLAFLLMFCSLGCRDDDDNEAPPPPPVEEVSCTEARGEASGEAIIPNTLADVKGDEWGNHGTSGFDERYDAGIALPVSPQADFITNGRVNGSALYEVEQRGSLIPFQTTPDYFDGEPGYWRWTIPWGNIYYPAGQQEPAEGVQIEIRNLRSYYFSETDLQWHEIDRTTNEIAGAYYVNDFAGDASISANIQYDNQDGKIFLDPPPIGRVFHFFRGGSSSRTAIDRPENVRGMYTVCEARIVGPASAVAASELYLGMGLDVWADEFADGNDPSFTNHGDIMFSRHRRLDCSWRSFNGVAMAGNANINLDIYPPPLEW